MAYELKVFFAPHLDEPEFAFKDGQIAEIWAVSSDGDPHTHTADVFGSSMLGEDGDRRLAEVLAAAPLLFKSLTKLAEILDKFDTGHIDSTLPFVLQDAKDLLSTIRPYKEEDQ